MTRSHGGSLIGRLRRRLSRSHLESTVVALERRLDDVAANVGWLVLQETSRSDDLQDVRVFSQWGEDGILASLILRLPAVPRTFVEIGVGDYRECNTRLLASHGWSGVAFDADCQAVERAQALPEVWSGQARVLAAWLEPTTVDERIGSTGIQGEIGVLSIDVDGIDLYLLDAIQVVSPWIVVMEFNARYGPTEAVTVRYSPKFDRRAVHHSWLHHGVSLAGLEEWGTRRGYDLVGVNREGTNAFLVRGDLRPATLPVRTARELWRPLGFSEHHAADGAYEPVTFEREQEIVAALPTVEVRSALRPLAD